jgi:hypothetical protein
MSDDAVTKGPTKTRARRRRDGAGGGPAEPVCGAYAWRPRVRRHLQARGVRRQRRLCPRTTATTTVMVTRQGRRSAAMEMPRAEGGQGAGVAGAGEGDGGARVRRLLEPDELRIWVGAQVRRFLEPDELRIWAGSRMKQLRLCGLEEGVGFAGGHARRERTWRG